MDDPFEPDRSVTMDPDDSGLDTLYSDSKPVHPPRKLVLIQLSMDNIDVFFLENLPNPSIHNKIQTVTPEKSDLMVQQDKPSRNAPPSGPGCPPAEGTAIPAQSSS